MQRLYRGRTYILNGMRVINSTSAALAWCEERIGRSSPDEALEASVREIIADVRQRGDAALVDHTARFDGVDLSGVLVGAAELEGAESELDPELAAAIRLAARRVEEYYRHQPEGGFLYAADGAMLGQLVVPLSSVGCYVPGGSAPLFSSVLMTAVPARVAGVERVVVATPPAEDGSVPAAVRFAARLAGAPQGMRVGGPQAIAGLAYGTASVQRVDKVVGPGNRYVVEAKRQLYGTVGIESLPGPTETLVVADDSADAGHVVADLLAQAEHAGAQPVLVTPSLALLEHVLEALPRAAAALPDPRSAGQSVEERGVAVLVEDLDAAMVVANAYAPEHLCLLVDDPWSLAAKARNAGGLFLGADSLEALGDYVVGPSHVMPTGTTARFSSFLNLRDFQKVMPLTYLSRAVVEDVGPAAALMARAEGLEAHARAVESRLRR
jgi:histidinol dehydrogenase